MSQTAVLVWLSAASALPTFRADVDGFAHSRLVRLEAPRENAASFSGFAASAYAPDAVAQVESSLEEARRAAASLEQERALTALQRAERTLREHPELPQSAWLMAEVLQISAEVESSAPGGADAANALQMRARALEGQRAAPFSDREASPGAAEENSRPFSIEGLEPDDALEWDGAPVSNPVASVAGEHHARVSRNGRLLWAGWVSLGTGEARAHLPVPETVACSPDDVGRARFAGGRAIPNPHTRCESYVLAHARAGGGIEAALCERTTCSKVVIWDHVAAERRPAPTEKKSLWPYAIAASAGAVVITGLALWRAGVFDRPEATTTERWVFVGQKQMGLSF